MQKFMDLLTLVIMKAYKKPSN